MEKDKEESTLKDIYDGDTFQVWYNPDDDKMNIHFYFNDITMPVSREYWDELLEDFTKAHIEKNSNGHLRVVK